MAELNFPNMAEAFARGTQQGAERRNDRQQQDDRASLRGLAPGIMAGDPNALQAAAVISPEAAQQYQGVGDAQLRRLKGAIDYMDNAKKTGNMQAVEAAWRQVRPYLSQNSPDGQEPPESFAEAEPKMEEARAKIAMAMQGAQQGRVQSTYIDNQGQRVAIMADGSTQILGQNAPNNQIIDTGNGFVGVNKGNLQAAPVTLGGAPQANAPAAQGAHPNQEVVTAAANAMIAAGVPEAQVDAFVQSQLSAPVSASAPAQGDQLRSTPDPAKQQQLELARQANARAEEASQRATEAAANAQRGNAPAGFRFKADGSLEPIPGGPKPAGTVATEGERKSATLLARLTGSLAQLEQAVGEDPSAASPNLLASGVGAVLGNTAANAITPANRQRVEAAQLDILDAALTLGTGAAYTREQLEGYRKSYFPQIGDSPSTIADKQDRLNNVIAAARIAAGRAAPALESAPAARQISRTGTLNGRKVVQYSDGTTEYAD